MEEYKISLWEDYSTFCYIQDNEVTSQNFSNKVYYTKSGNTYTRAQSYQSGVTYYYKKQYFDERKICDIGSNDNHSQIRAFEPQLTEDINGTHSFTFKLFYNYIDELTGEKLKNPIINYLSNERKIKVKWKNEWYDFIIKNSNEDSGGKSITYTCTDLFINELSKNGYNLEFNSELQNNTGTVKELSEKILEGTDWQYDNTSDTIIQKNEEPVYEVGNETSPTYVVHEFIATKHIIGQEDQDELIPNEAFFLVFYSQVQNLYKNNDTTTITKESIQFLYDQYGYMTEENSMLVTNGNYYSVELYWKNSVDGYLNAYKNYSNGQVSGFVFRINCANGVSENYRAKRLVQTQISEYDELLERYCYLYLEGNDQNAKQVYGIETTEYSDFLEVSNYLTNSSSFSNTNGWIGESIGKWMMYPKFTSSSSLDTYEAKSYLLVNSGNIYNTCFESNTSKFTPTTSEIKAGKVGGFQIGDQFIFRYKAKTSIKDDPSDENSYPGNYITEGILPFICVHSNHLIPSGANNYISYQKRTTANNWIEYLCTVNTAVTANEIQTLGFFIQPDNSYWIEEIQFFKYATGISIEQGSEGQTKTIYPGEASTLSVAKKIYRYFYKNHTTNGNPIDPITNPAAEDAKDLVYIYTGTEKASISLYTPVYNNYEKYGTIEEKESNRFNILQSIAETFQCWIRFRIEHENDGKIKIINGIPQKFIKFVEEVGEDNGLSFEYGIDLKSISRIIASDSIATKIIVLPNQNDFAINGFCTIARSDQNYSKENFILDLGYYTSQGLINQEELNKDLYSTQEEYLGYYYYLHKWNSEYDTIAEKLNELNSELLKQKSEFKVTSSKLTSIKEEISDTKSDLMRLANVDTWESVQTYAQSHSDNTKVQSLMNSFAQLSVNEKECKDKKDNLEDAIDAFELQIQAYNLTQSSLLNNINNLHEQFNKKYSQYLQEGTWQDENYIDDNLYYLDGLSVAYTSSRPQVSYDINVIRVSSLDEFKSKIFRLGDICYVQDREFFGYGADGVTPYKEKILVSKIVSNFDSPEKDTITVQNYKTQFDDLFQRITATTQSLQYAEGSYNKAAGIINPDKTLSFAVLQDTFDYNSNLVLNASNQNVVWDSTGITVTDNTDSAKKAKLMSGGLFISNDGGANWKNAVRGDGISADVLTSGKINTSEIYLYDGNQSTFRWDSQGITSYYFNNNTSSFDKYVRFNKFGIYGYAGTEDFTPNLEEEIWENQYAKFGLTWKGFFLKGGSSDNSELTIKSFNNGNNDSIVFSIKNWSNTSTLELTADDGLILKRKDLDASQYIPMINVGRFDDRYGIRVRNSKGQNVFTIDSTGQSDSIGGWNLDENSFSNTSSSGTIGFYSNGKSAIIQGHQDNYVIYANSKFGVTAAGGVYASDGKIGGWSIGENQLSSDSNGTGIVLSSNGSISATGTDGTTSGSWNISKTGKATFTNIQADGGTIAGWTITNSGLSGAAGIISPNATNYHFNTNSITINGDSGLKVESGGGITAGNLKIEQNKISLSADTNSTLTFEDSYIKLGTKTRIKGSLLLYNSSNVSSIQLYPDSKTINVRNIVLDNPSESSAYTDVTLNFDALNTLLNRSSSVYNKYLKCDTTGKLTWAEGGGSGETDPTFNTVKITGSGVGVLDVTGSILAGSIQTTGSYVSTEGNLILQKNTQQSNPYICIGSVLQDQNKIYQADINRLKVLATGTTNYYLKKTDEGIEWAAGSGGGIQPGDNAQLTSLNINNGKIMLNSTGVITTSNNITLSNGNITLSKNDAKISIGTNPDTITIGQGDLLRLTQLGGSSYVGNYLRKTNGGIEWVEIPSGGGIQPGDSTYLSQLQIKSGGTSYITLSCSGRYPGVVSAHYLSLVNGDYDKTINYSDLVNIMKVSDVLNGNGNVSQVLTKTSTGYSWQDAQGGGSSNPTFSTITVTGAAYFQNGINIATSTAPTTYQSITYQNAHDLIYGINILNTIRTTGSIDQYLKKTSNGVEWTTVPGGGTAVFG